MPAPQAQSPRGRAPRGACSPHPPGSHVRHGGGQGASAAGSSGALQVPGLTQRLLCSVNTGGRVGGSAPSTLASEAGQAPLRPAPSATTKLFLSRLLSSLLRTRK